MNILQKIILVAFLVLGLFACTHVTSGAPTTNTVSGEAWYVKSTGMGSFLTFSTSVYYCPATSGKGPATCTKAIIHEAGAAPAASSSSDDDDSGYGGGDSEEDEGSGDAENAEGSAESDY